MRRRNDVRLAVIVMREGGAASAACRQCLPSKTCSEERRLVVAFRLPRSTCPWRLPRADSERCANSCRVLDGKAAGRFKRS